MSDALNAIAIPDLTWVYGREGYLTALQPGDCWYTGCSVPLLAARTMLRTLESGSGVACFLKPYHAAQVRVALDRHGENHALICLTPDEIGLAVLLCCDDFSADIARGRLWFAWEDDWSVKLSGLLEATPGLPTPSRFIRMPNTDPAIAERLVQEAQQVFTAHNARRSALIADRRSSWRPAGTSSGKQSVCVLARSAFRLWDDAGHALFTAMDGDETANVTRQRFDPDDPAESSPLALATAAAASDVVVAADLFRADAGALTAADQPWITWVTTPRIPSAQSAGPNDRLLLADPRWCDAALRAGWPADRVSQAAWPQNNVRDSANQERTAKPCLAIIADTCPLDPPEALADFSSHGLLWEKVRRRLAVEPFALPDVVESWLRDQARADGVNPDNLDVPLFLNRLIIPAYQQSLADVLLAAGVPVQLHGVGWADLPRFRAHAMGPVRSRDELYEVARQVKALVHAWPNTAAHAIDTLGRHVVRPTGRRSESFVREAKLAISSTTPAPFSSSAVIAPLSASSVLGV